MSRISRVPEGAMPFLSPEELAESAKGWKEETHRREIPKKHSYGYITDRQEEDPRSGRDKIEDLHGVSFLKTVIPDLLKKKQGGKLKILDNGAGIGLFSDQIRNAFGDQVEVYSTGLSKRKAERNRKNRRISALHNQDLKWRSIEELSDFPEFDLIVDTFGEQFYKPSSVRKLTWEESENQIHQRKVDAWHRHVELVVRKLNPGGFASLAPLASTKEELATFIYKIQENFPFEYKSDEHVLRIWKK